MPSNSRAVVVLCICMIALGGVGYAGKEFALPTPQPAATYPAHDDHSDERVTVAADPYDMADKASIFTIPYADVDMLPVFVVITNDGDQPIALNGMKVEFITSKRTKLAPATQDDMYRRLSHTHKPGGVPLPFPIPGRSKSAVSNKALDEIQRAQFSARAVEPHSTQAGFFFFDIDGISTPLPGAHVYLTGVRNAKGEELMYFEVALEKYLSAPQPVKPATAPAK
jgi:hypothetical protein